MAKKLEISKGKLLDRYQSNLAVRVAKSEAIMINQTKEWMKTPEVGIDIERFEKISRGQCKRSKTIIFVKNLPYSTKEGDLRELFERYGELVRLLISPSNTLAVVEY